VDSVPFIDLACRRSAGQIIRSTLRLYGDYPWLFLVLAAAVVAPWELVRLAVTGGGPFGHIHHESFLERQSLTLIDLLLISPLISAMHVHAVAVIGERQRARLGSVAQSGVRVLPVVGIAALVAGIATDIGFLALVIPGILLAIRFSVVAQAAAVERRGVRAALRRSWQLTRNNGWHVLSLYLIIGTLFLGVALGALALTTGTGARPGEVAAGIVVNTIIFSFGALATALLYFDLVSRQEESAPSAYSTLARSPA